ncbi:MAG: ThuA domain-containing protein [Gemmataceae bacterium]
MVPARREARCRGPLASSPSLPAASPAAHPRIEDLHREPPPSALRRPSAGHCRRRRRRRPANPRHPDRRPEQPQLAGHHAGAEKAAGGGQTVQGRRVQPPEGRRQARAVDTVPFPPDLGKYDVLVTNYNGASWPKEFNAQLDERLKDGKIALVVVHAANNAFTGWKEYNEMIGMGWRGNNFGARLTVDDGGKTVRLPAGKGPGAGHGPKHAFKMTVRDAEHPVTRGMPTEWMHTADELYHGMRGPIKNVHVLATAYSEKRTGGTGEHEPILWTVMYGKGRVFHTTLGHDLDGIRCVGFLGSFQRGTEWAATGKVTLPLPEQFPTADKASSIPAGKGR